MILHDPATPFRFQPDPTSGTTYLLRTPKVIDRINYRRAVRVSGGIRWSELQMLNILEQSIQRLLIDQSDTPYRERMLDEIRSYRTRFSQVLDEFRQGAFDRLDEEESDEAQRAYLRQLMERTTPPPAINEAERFVLETEGPAGRYVSMAADRELYPLIAGVVATRMFLIGWEGINLEFKKTRNGEVPEEVLSQLPTADLIMIGNQVERMLEPTKEQLKNLPSPSGTPGDPTPSDGTETPPLNNPSSMTSGVATSSEFPSSASIH